MRIESTIQQHRHDSVRLLLHNRTLITFKLI